MSKSRLLGIFQYKRSSLDKSFHQGEIVEVAAENEIMATLDRNCQLEGLPFTEEMRKFCGKRYKVLKNVQKITVEGVGVFRIKNTVMLEGVTCDGKAHKGCQRTCLLLWKTAWLKKVVASDRTVNNR